MTSDGGSTSPFFVVGSSRSGTTLLRLMLNAHSRLFVPLESHFLVELMDRLPLTGVLTPDQVLLAVTLITTHPRWKDWEIDDRELSRALESVPHPTLAALIDAAFRIRIDGKPRWGDKTPKYVTHISRLAEVFQDARFIHVIRDAHDVCLSLQKTGWHGDTTWDIAKYWRDSVQTGRTQGSQLSEGRYLELAYEDLVLDTRSTLARVCGFLEESFEEKMLESHASAKEHIAPWEASIHAKTQRPPRADDVRRWRTEMPVLQVAIVEAVAGDLMDDLAQPRRFRGSMQLTRLALELAFWAARVSLPMRRRLRLHFPRLRRRL